MPSDPQFQHLSDADEDESVSSKIREIAGWVAEHVEVEINFEGVSELIVCDVELDVAPYRGLLRSSERWMPLSDNAGLLIRPAGNADGPYAWVLGTDDGPASSVVISPALSSKTSPTPAIGELVVPSGWLAVGSPDAVEWWRSRERPDTGRDATFLNDWDFPGPLRDGYCALIRVREPRLCTYEIDLSEGETIGSATIRLPLPPWIPPQGRLLGKPIV